MQRPPEQQKRLSLHRVRALARTLTRQSQTQQLDMVALTLAIWLAAATFAALIERAPPAPPADGSVTAMQAASGAVWVPPPATPGASPFMPIAFTEVAQTGQ